MKRVSCLVVGCLLGVVGPVFGATIKVPADQPTIQEGIDAAGAGDIVLVSPGTYAENLEIRKGDIELRGSGSATTIINGGAEGRVIWIDQQSNVTVSGFTIKNGRIDGGDDNDGGGILVNDSDTITISHNTITANQVTGTNADGGGIMVLRDSGPFVISGNVITNNVAENWGGGICLHSSCGIQIERNNIARDQAGVGAGISLYAGSSATLENNRIANNTGTGIYLDSGCTATIGGAQEGANALTGNTNYALINRSGNLIDATYNYWGSILEDDVQAAIYDDLDEPGVGLVAYDPWVAKTDQPLDLAVTITDAPDPVPLANNVTYTVTVQNLGPSSAGKVVLADTTPLSSTVVSANASKGTCSTAAHVVTCNLGAMTSVETVTVTIVVTAPDSAVAMNNTAEVSCTTGQDFDLSNNAAAVRTSVGQAPVNGTLAPANVTSLVNTPQSFTAVYTDADGATNLRAVELRVNSTSSGAGAIWAKYNRVLNRLYLLDDAGTIPVGTVCAPGDAGTIENSQGILDCATTTVGTNGNDLTVNWNLTPKTGFDGTQKVFMKASDLSSQTTGWQKRGSWRINP